MSRRASERLEKVPATLVMSLTSLFTRSWDSSTTPAYSGHRKGR